MSIAHKPILAIETSASACGAAVFVSEAEYSECVLHKTRSHASAITTVIEGAMKNLGCVMQDFGCVAVSCGPGSFTGLRIGLSMAKGICFGSGKPLVPVPTFDASAIEIAELLGFCDSRFSIVSKVNTTEVFVGAYEISGGSITVRKPVDSILREIAASQLEEGEFLCAPENWFGKKNYINFQSPKPRFLARWAFENPASAKVGAEIDFLEPFYGKDFVVKKKEKPL